MNKYTAEQVAELKRIMLVTVHNMADNFVWTHEELQRAIAIGSTFVDTLTHSSLETMTHQDVATKIISVKPSPPGPPGPPGPPMEATSPLPTWAGAALIATALGVWCLVIYTVIT